MDYPTFGAPFFRKYIVTLNLTSQSVSLSNGTEVTTWSELDLSLLTAGIVVFGLLLIVAVALAVVKFLRDRRMQVDRALTDTTHTYIDPLFEDDPATTAEGCELQGSREAN